jgi:hypothetical protein
MNRVFGILSACFTGLLLIAALVAFLFYKWFYLACPDDFNEMGRCFSTDGMIVYDADSFVWLPISICLIVGAITFGFLSWRLLRKPKVST